MDRVQREAMLLRAGVSRDDLLAASREAAELWAERHESNVLDSYALHPEDYAIGPNGDVGRAGVDFDFDEQGRYDEGSQDYYYATDGRGGGGAVPAELDGGSEDLGATWYPRQQGGKRR